MSLSHEIETALAHDQGSRAAEILLAAVAANHLTTADLKATGEAVTRQYRDFHTHPVHEFYTRLERDLPAPEYSVIFGPIQADFEATRFWDRRLDEIASERLVNGLVDKVKAKDMAAAEEAALALIIGVSEESRPQRAKFIGNILGGLIHEKDRAQALVKAMSRNPLKFGLDPITVTDVEEEFARGAVAATRRERAAGGASRQNLTDATVELGRQLPGRNVLQQPTEDDIHKFDRAIRAILRCCLLSPGHDKFNEATLLIVEFSPKEISTAGAMAGVEGRLYGTLGRTARMVADRVFQAVGQHPKIIHPYLDFSKKNLLEKIGRYCVEALGVFRNAETVPFLREVVANKEADARTEAIFALGAIGSEEALGDLQEALKRALSSRIIEGEQRREAFTIISALGRMVRSISDMDRRSRTVAQIVQLLPKEDLEFPVRAVLNFFTGKQDGMDPNLLRWAAQVAVTALWSTDRPELARAGRSQPLGFRQPLIDLLGRLAPFAMGTINETALKYAKLYSGAYLAMAELYTANPDPSQVPVIKQMLFNTALHDDTKKSEYVKQTVFDAATETQQEMTKDQVVAALARALDKIESDEARQAMSDLFLQIQSGQFPQPGPETSTILMRAFMAEQKKAGRATMAPGAKVAPRQPVPLVAGPSQEATVEDSLAESASDVLEPTQVTEDDLQLIEDLKARYLIATKRRAKKVAALNMLAQRKIAPALGPIIGHLGDGDKIIASAAEMALQDFAQPPIARQTQDQLQQEVLNTLETADNAVKVKLGEMLPKLGARKSPFKDKIEARLARPDLPLVVKTILQKAVGAGTPAASDTIHNRAVGQLDQEKLGAAAGYMPTAGGDKGEQFISDLDKKRAYMQARQEWIRGGKRGPEPKPPE